MFRSTTMYRHRRSGVFCFLFLLLALILSLSGAASATSWNFGDVVTYTQDVWGGGMTSAGQLLALQFSAVYPNGVDVGIPGAAGYSMLFLDQVAVYLYLPQTGPEGALISDLVDPTNSSSGVFGGDVLALQLDVDFADRGLLGATFPVAFGDLALFGFTTLPLLNGLTVREFLADANTALGGGTSIYTVIDFAPAVTNLSDAFNSGSVTVFAQEHLAAPSAPVSEPATMLLLGSGLVGLAGYGRKKLFKK